MTTYHVPATFMGLRLISGFALCYIDRFVSITEADFLYRALECEALNTI